MWQLKPVIPVLRFDNRDQAMFLSEVLVKGGFETLEITLTTPSALEIIEELKTKYGDDLKVGCGTVMNAKEAEEGIGAGADYLVAPIQDSNVVDVAKRHNKKIILGALSPTEIWNANQMGADLVKIFPANIGGPGMIKALKAVFSKIHLFPTGGVDLSNFRNYMEAGATHVGVGSAITGGIPISSINERKLIQHTQQYLQTA